MKAVGKAFLFLGGGICLLVFALAAAAWWYPLGNAPLGLHTWLPFPLVCVRWRCASYARWWKYHGGWVEELPPQESVRKLGELLRIEWAAQKSGVTLSGREEERARKHLNQALAGLGNADKVAAKLYGRRKDRLWEDVWQPWLLKQKLLRTDKGFTAPPARVLHRGF